MTTKITLDLNPDLVKSAEELANSQNMSLSELVEIHLKELIQIKRKEDEEFKSFEKLRGCIKIPNNVDIDDLRYQAIMEKHRRPISATK
jgi:hypothetical protein